MNNRKRQRQRQCHSDNHQKRLITLLLLSLSFDSNAFVPKPTTGHVDPLLPSTKASVQFLSQRQRASAVTSTRLLQVSIFQNVFQIRTKRKEGKESRSTVMMNYQKNSTNETNVTSIETLKVNVTSQNQTNNKESSPSPIKGFSSLSSNFATISSSLKNSTKAAFAQPPQTYQYTPTTLKPTFKKAKKNNINKKDELTLPPSLENSLQGNDTIKLSDLQEILKHNGYVRKEELDEEANRRKENELLFFSQETQKRSSSGDSSRGSGSVAFPQPSILSYKSLQRGTTISSALYGMILSTTILPNLWLMGLLFGGIYGFEITKGRIEAMPKNVVAKFCIYSGRKLAKVALELYDRFQTLWFLYKTGQLSYEYYKRYEQLDERFAIQDKMDAWNARFQEGKIKFDQWEKENEIGRTILAGLRTVWLVDEQARLRAKQRSRYRVIQYLYDVKYYVGVGWKNLSTLLREKILSGDVTSWSEFWSGVLNDISTSGAIGTRIGAIIASLIAVNITGALFTISPTFLACLAIIAGVVWPSWVSEFWQRLQELTEETRARGRGDDYESPPNKRGNINTSRLLGRYDKNRYHYYRRTDGTKQFYRTGKSLFTFSKRKEKDENALTWPWNREKKQPVNPWGALGDLMKGQNK